VESVFRRRSPLHSKWWTAVREVTTTARCDITSSDYRWDDDDDDDDNNNNNNSDVVVVMTTKIPLPVKV
jgi:hypothetical protein